MRYHLSKNGRPNVCKATKSNCPLGSNAEHFDSPSDARNFYEEKMSKETNPLIGSLKFKVKSSIRKRNYSELTEENIQIMNERFSSFNSKYKSLEKKEENNSWS